MNKPLIVLADTDATYLIPLEEKLTEELFGQADLEVITDQKFAEYFSTPRTIDTLIVSEHLYSAELMRHNVSNMFVLSEDSSSDNGANNYTKIFKYSSTKEIFNQIVFKNKGIKRSQAIQKETQVIVVSSPIGGAGKTTVAMALSLSLARNHKRVLFVSLDTMQSFSHYLGNKSTVPGGINKAVAAPEEKFFSSIMPYIRSEAFYYFPPFAHNIITVGLDYSFYGKMVKAAKESKEYDYIVIDTSLEFDDARADLIKNADKVIMIVLQDMISTSKTEFMIQNIDCRNKDKFMFVCNKFRRDLSNDYINSPIGQQYIISEYIDELPPFSGGSLDNYADLTGRKNMGYILS